MKSELCGWGAQGRLAQYNLCASPWSSVGSVLKLILLPAAPAYEGTGRIHAASLSWGSLATLGQPRYTAPVKAAIIGLAGPQLAPEEARLLRHHAPVGVILFARNIASPEQLRELVGDVRGARRGGADGRPGRRAGGAPAAAALAGASAGGGAGARCGRAACLTGALIGLDARPRGSTWSRPRCSTGGCGGADGDRRPRLREDPHAVARLGRALADGLLAAGVQPVRKHVPGHGAARWTATWSCRSCATDEAAIGCRSSESAGLPWMMTAHIRYPALDTELPATLSARILGEVVRGRIGFAGVLVSDDLAMQALSGTAAERALAALAAGCDVALYCAVRRDRRCWRVPSAQRRRGPVGGGARDGGGAACSAGRGRPGAGAGRLLT